MTALNAITLPIGADRNLRYTVYTSAAQATCRNVSGFTLQWMLKRKVGQPDAQALLTKTSDDISIEGTFNSDPAVNTQRVVVAISAEDTDGLAPGLAFCELKRMDDGFESPLSPQPDQVTLLRGVVRA